MAAAQTSAAGQPLRPAAEGPARGGSRRPDRRDRSQRDRRRAGPAYAAGTGPDVGQHRNQPKHPPPSRRRTDVGSCRNRAHAVSQRIRGNNGRPWPGWLVVAEPLRVDAQSSRPPHRARYCHEPRRGSASRSRCRHLADAAGLHNRHANRSPQHLDCQHPPHRRSPVHRGWTGPVSAGAGRGLSRAGDIGRPRTFPTLTTSSCRRCWIWDCRGPLC